MRFSKLFAPTLKEVPAEAEVASHILMLRAGMIRKVAAGVYAFLPLGKRVLDKVEKIIRQEMDRSGALEVLMPALQPAELWMKSGRWYEYGPEMMRLTDRQGRDFGLGPTHEELITTLFDAETRSYRELPRNLYQIQVKFRDEIRPRFGLMRAREFIMKDAYSFDVDEQGMVESYTKMYEAYSRIFTRCGLRFRSVEAESGLIGGRVSEEFMVLAETGEELVLSCPSCSYAANVETATTRDGGLATQEQPKPRELVATPDAKSVSEVSSLLGVGEHEIVKTLIYQTDKALKAVLVAGHREANEAKVVREIGADAHLLAEDDFAGVGLVPGFVGPVDLNPTIEIVADSELKHLSNFVAGANKAQAHFVNVNEGVDFHAGRWADLRLAAPGDACRDCGATLVGTRGVEVGHVFQLGTKYSESMGAMFTDADGRQRPFVMGCYGIGVTRLMAAAIEQGSDERGIAWPMPLAPYQVVVIPIGEGEPAQRALAIYRDLEAAGVEVLLDDRGESPGAKFADADLIGFPIQVIIGAKSLASGQAEVKTRRTGQRVLYPLAEVASVVAQAVADEMGRLERVANEGAESRAST